MKTKGKLGQIIFVTGTDTGVGKTFLVSMLVHHLRQDGVHALAMKPFCSGGRDDVKSIQSVQRGELTDDEVNPFYFPEPVAPLVSLQYRGKEIGLREVVQRVRRVQKRCQTLVIEGSGGLLVPISEGLVVLDLIRELHCKVIVVGRNRLGTINHTLLTVNTLKQSGLRDITVVLMDSKRLDVSSLTNVTVIRGILDLPIWRIPFLTNKYKGFLMVEDRCKKIKKVLAQILC